MGIWTLLTGKVTNKAVFHNQKGEFIETIKFKNNTDRFQCKYGTYLYRKDATSRRIRGIFKDSDEYLYSIENIKPVKITGEGFNYVDINPKELDAMLETKLALDLNNLNKKFNLNLGMILWIGGAVLMAIILFVVIGSSFK